MEHTEVKLIEKIQIKLKIFFTKDIKKKMLVFYFVINLMYLLIGSYIFVTERITDNFHYEDFSIGLKYLFILNLIVFLVIIIKKKYKKNVVHIGIIFAVVFSIISMLFAIDKNIALEGCLGRYEGIFSILYYLTIMLLSTFVKGKYKKIIVKVLLFCGAFQAIYAICQSFSFFNVKQIWHTKEYFDERANTMVSDKHVWVTGLVTHPNFLGTYMLLCLSYSLGLVIDSKKIKSIFFYSLLTALFMFGLLLSNTAGCAVGLIIVGILIFVYVIKNKLYKNLIIIITIIISTTFLATKLGKTKFVEEINKAGSEAVEIAKGNLDDNFGTKRMYVWKKTMKIIPQYLLHGVGIDNFTKAFNGKALIRKIEDRLCLYDKAHNEYLQMLVTQGIFALATYLFIYGYAVLKGTKHAFKNKEIYLVLPVIGYLVQAFFNISVIEVAPMFYIALGLCCSKEE